MFNDDNQPSTSSSNAFSFISKGWREVRDSADADFQLMRDRANSFKNNLASSFDRELENFINSASTNFSINKSSPLSSRAEIDFVKKLQPKISELRRAYSAPDFRKRVLEKWGPRGGARIRIDLSAIRNAIVSEAVDEEYGDGIIEFERGRRRSTVLNFREFWGEWKSAEEGEREEKEWPPLRALKTRLKEFEKKREESAVEFVEKFKSSFVCD